MITMINTDELTVWLLFISATFFLISLGVLLYACALVLEVRHKVKAFTWRPERVRNDKDWPSVNGRQG